ncbi:G patch domain-containing protein 2-like [Antedon mediterranea]|uniref:G patch domain-containing protein 2-like n=1 Tax=Antedon mediterranea TaxID=105859 RepID=UPI003AF4D08C
MEDLAHDLADALDVHVANIEQDNDGPSSTVTSPKQLRRQSRKRRGRKRRCDQNPLCDCGNLSSGSDSSYDDALKDYIENIKAQQDLSDTASDEMIVVQRSSVTVTSSTSNVYGESDSVTENYNIHKQPHRKKKRMRRMIIDRETNDIISNVPIQDYVSQTRKRRRKLRKTKKNDKDNTVLKLEGAFGYKVKQKSNSEKCKNSSTECAASTSMSLEHESKSMDFLAPDHEDSMEDLGTPTSNADLESVQDSDVTMEAKDRDTEEFAAASSHSSSSFSSSSSDDDGNIVVFTNDEGREGDDEQSDFFHEPGGVYGIPGIIPWWEKQVKDFDPKFQNILEGSFPLMSICSQSGFHNQVQKFENADDFRIRNSRRKGKVKQKTSNSFLHNVNQKIVRFLKNQHEDELWLAPMKKKTRIQIGQLASLYNLDVKNEWTNKKCSLTLFKTRNSYIADQGTIDEYLLAVASNGKVKHYPPYLDPKRRRKTPPTSIPFQEGYVDRYSNPIPNSNIGNQMLQNMGWKPGTGLGADGSGIQEPIRAFQRQKNKGLGYDKLK